MEEYGVALPDSIQRFARPGVVGINGLFSLFTTGTNIYGKSYF